jgi:uncharacterized protein YjdB
VFAIAIILAIASLALQVIGDLIQTKPRTPRPNITGVDPPLAEQGTPIPVVFGTQRLSPNIVWWGNARTIGIAAYPGVYSYGFDYAGVIAMAVDKIWDVVYDTKSAVQYTRLRTYINQYGNQVTGPVLVTITGDQFPLTQSAFSARPASMVINAPLIFGGPTSEGGISGSYMDLFLGSPTQPASSSLASVIGQSQGSKTPIVQPNYPSMCYVVAYAASPTTSDATVTPGMGNTGNGTVTGITMTSAFFAYSILITLNSATTFTVTQPADSVTIGTGTVGTPFTSVNVNFTVNAGSTPFVNGDTFTLAVAAGTAGNTNSGYFGTSPYPKPVSFVCSRFPNALSTLIGSDYSTFATYDANPIECIYDILTSSYWPAGLSPLLNIPSAAIDVGSFKTACTQVWTEAVFGTTTGVPYPKTINGGNAQVGVFNDIAGGVGPVEQITVTITSSTTFSVVGTISGTMSSGTIGTLYTGVATAGPATGQTVIQFLLTNDTNTGDAWTFYMTLISSAGVSFNVGHSDAAAAEEAIRDLLALVDGVLFEHPETGLITIQLCRGGYVLESQPLIDEGNMREPEYSETSWPDTYNEVSVRYQNRGVDNTALVQVTGDAWAFKQGVATIQNLASLASSGGIPRVADPLDYPQISNGLAAAVVAQTALRIVSVPRARLQCKVTRFGHSFTPGMVFRFSWAAQGISNKAMRITNVDYGTLEDGLITLTSTADVYATAPPLLPPLTFLTSANNPPPVTPVTTLSITLTPVTATVAIGSTVTLTATAYQGSTGVADTFTYTSGSPTTASVGMTGIVLGVTLGTTVITATDPFGNTATMTVTVVSAATPVITTVSIAPSTAALMVGQTQTFTGSALDQFGNPIADTFTYSVSDATKGSVDPSTGVFLATAVGTVDVLATDGASNVATAVVTISTPSTAGMAVVIPASGYLGSSLTALGGGGAGLTGAGSRIRAIVQGASGSGTSGLLTICDPTGTIWTLDLAFSYSSGVTTFYGAFTNAAPVVLFTATDAELGSPLTTWTIGAQYSSTTGATVQIESDDATVLKTWSAANGTAGCGSGMTNTLAVNFGVGVSVSSGTLVPSTWFAVGGYEVTTGALPRVAGVPSLSDANYGAYYDFDASSLVEANGGTALTAVGGAVSYIAEPGPDPWGLSTGTAVPSSIRITPTSITLAPGESFTPTFGAYDQYGLPIADTITWSSSATAYATVNATTGSILAVADGSATMTATDGTYSATITVTVSSTTPVVTTLNITPTTASVQVGANAHFTGVPLDQFGDSIVDTLTFSSGTPAVATINAITGIATGVAVGSTTISVTDGTRTANATLTVTNTPPPVTNFTTFGAHVNAGYDTSTGPIDALIALAPPVHAKVGRDIALWAHIEGTMGTFVWTYLDRVIADYESAGITPYITIYSVPPWTAGYSSTNGEQGVPTNSSDFTTLISQSLPFITALITRYAGRVTYYEFLNEPNQPYFWIPTPNVAFYTQWNNAAYTAAKAAASAAGVQIVWASCVATGLVAGPSSGYLGLTFIQDFISGGGLCDAISIHPYCGADPLVDNYPSNNSFGPDIIRAQNLLASNNLNIPLHITEWGWSSASSSTIATYVTESLTFVENNNTGVNKISGSTVVSGFGRIPIATIFMLQDTASFSYGLYTTGASLKLQGTAFTNFAESVGQ